jgi:peptide/nickel transport system ATP-binding protein
MSISASSHILAVKDLGVVLEGAGAWVEALSALEFCIEAGQTFALVGESGCGKSMTALALMQLLPEVARINGGEVNLKGQDLLDLTEREMQQFRGRRISIVFQEPATSLNPVMRLGDQVTEGILQHSPHLSRGEAAQKARGWFERVGLEDVDKRFDQYAFELSGGQLQRVMIAMALAAEPDLLIADEPTTALDVTLQAQVLELLKSLQHERKMALLLITHDLAVVKGMADQVALMYAGEIVEVCEAKRFFHEARHPYSQLLMQSLPTPSKRGGDLAAIAGQVPPLSQAFLGCRFEPRCPHALAMCKSPQASTMRRVTAPLEKSNGGTTHQAQRQVHSVRCVRAHESEVQWSEVQLSEIQLRPSPLGNGSSAVGMKASPLNSEARPESPLLKVADLKVTYGTTGASWFGGNNKVFEAVKGVSFEIAKGQTLALVGESGCGKTTLGKAMIQVLGSKAQVSGEVILSGQSLLSKRKETLREARRQMQIIFQNPFASLNPRMRIEDILQEGMVSLRPSWSAAQRGRDILELLDQVGLARTSLTRYPHEFSGGQRQRIAIARALAIKPQLIICDEPTSALDVSIQAQILNLLRELQTRLGVSYLFITHNMGVVSYLAHQVAVMKSGVFVEVGKTEDVLENPQHPYTRRLLESVPRL